MYILLNIFFIFYLKVIKAWPDAKQVEVKDEKLLGYPQVILHLNHNELQQEKIIVTHESDWDIKNKDDQPLLEGESALSSVAQALEAQAKKAHGNLLLLEKQISFRKSLAVHALTALNDMITAKANNLQPVGILLMFIHTYSCVQFNFIML